MKAIRFMAIVIAVTGYASTALACNAPNTKISTDSHDMRLQAQAKANLPQIASIQTQGETQTTK